jgi:hypothetical protein
MLLPPPGDAQFFTVRVGLYRFSRSLTPDPAAPMQAFLHMAGCYARCKRYQHALGCIPCDAVVALVARDNRQAAYLGMVLHFRQWPS